MKKDEFYIKLANSLQDVSLDEQQKVLDYYEELISDRMDSGMSEEEAVASLGDPEKLAKEALADIVQKQELPPQPEKTPVVKNEPAPVQEPAPKKKKRVWLRVLIILTVVAVLLTGLAAAAGYFYIHSTVATRSIHLNDNIHHIVFDAEAGDLRIIEDDSRAGLVEFKETALENWSFLQTDDTVYFDEETELGFGAFDTCCTIYVAKGMLESLTAETSSGDIVLTAGEIMSVDLRTSSGDVELRGQADTINVHTSSGDIEMGASYRDAVLVSASGDVELEYCVGTNLTVETRSGEVEGTYCANAADCTINAHSSSGEIEIPYGGGKTYVISITTSSGDIEVDFIP